MAHPDTHLGAHASDERRTGWLVLIVGAVLAVGVLMIPGVIEFTSLPLMTEPNLAPVGNTFLKYATPPVRGCVNAGK